MARLTDTQAHHDWKKKLSPAMLERANKIVAARPTLGEKVASTPAMSAPAVFVKQADIPEPDGTLLKLGKSFGNTLMGVATMGSAAPMTVFSKIVEGTTGKKGADWSDALGTFSEDYKGWYGDVLKPQFGAESKWWAGAGLGLDIALDLWWLVAPVKIAKGLNTSAEIVKFAKSVQPEFISASGSRNADVFDAGLKIDDAASVAAYSDDLDKIAPLPQKLVARPIKDFKPDPELGVLEAVESAGGDIVSLKFTPEALAERGYKLDDASWGGGWVPFRVSDAREVIPELGASGVNASKVATSDPAALRKVINSAGNDYILGQHATIRGNLKDHLNEISGWVGAAAIIQRRQYVDRMRRLQAGGKSIADIPPGMISQLVSRNANELFDADTIDAQIAKFVEQGNMFDKQGRAATTADDAMDLDVTAKYMIAQETKKQYLASMNMIGGDTANPFLRTTKDGKIGLTQKGIENLTSDMAAFRNEAIAAQLIDHRIGLAFKYIDQAGKLNPVLAGASLSPGARMVTSIADLTMMKQGSLTGKGAANDLIKIPDAAKASLGLKAGFGKFGYQSRMSGGIRGNIRISKKEFDRMWDQTHDEITKAIEQPPLKGIIQPEQVDDIVDELMFEAWTPNAYRKTAKRLNEGDWTTRRDYARGENEGVKDWLNRMHVEFDTRIPAGSVLGGISMAKAANYQTAKVPAADEGFGGRVARGLKRQVQYPLYAIRMKPMQVLVREMQKSTSEVMRNLPEKLRESLLRRGYTQDDMIGLWLYSVATDPKLDKNMVEASLRKIIGEIDDEFQGVIDEFLEQMSKKQDDWVVDSVETRLKELDIWRDDFQEVLEDWVYVRNRFEKMTGFEPTQVERMLQWRLPLLLGEASQRKLRNMPEAVQKDIKGNRIPALEGAAREVDTPTRSLKTANYLRQYESVEQFSHVIKRTLNPDKLTPAAIKAIDELAFAINQIYKEVDKTLIPTTLSMNPLIKAFQNAGGDVNKYVAEAPRQMFMRPYQIMLDEAGKEGALLDQKAIERFTEKAGFDPRRRMFEYMNKSKDNNFKFDTPEGEISADKMLEADIKQFQEELGPGGWEKFLKEIYYEDEQLVFAIAEKSPLRGETKKGVSFDTKEEMFDAQIANKFQDASTPLADETRAGLNLLAEMDPAILFGSQMAASVVQFHANKVIPLALMDMPFYEYVQDQNRVLLGFSNKRFEGKDLPQVPGFVKIKDDLAEPEKLAAKQMLIDLGFENINTKQKGQQLRVRQFSDDPEATKMGNMFPDGAPDQELYRFTGKVVNDWKNVTESWVSQGAQLLKFAFTTPFFRHFINNAAGDYFNVMVKAGATDSNKALRTAMFWQTRNIDPETGLQRWNTRGGLDANRMTARDFDFEQPIMTINGIEYNGYEIDTMANMVGLGRGFAGSDILHEGKSIAGIDAFFDTYQNVQASVAKTGSVKKVTEQYLSWAARQNIMRENAIRLHSYMAHLQQGHSPIMAMWNTVDNIFDYGALTPIEKNLVRHLILFYTWMRKNTSYQLRMAPQRLPYYAAFAGHNLTYQANIYDVNRGELSMSDVSRFMLPNGFGLKFGEMPHYDLFELPDPIDFIGFGQQVAKGNYLGAPAALVDQHLPMYEGEPGAEQSTLGSFTLKRIFASSPLAPVAEGVTNRNFFTGGENVKYQGHQQEVGSALGMFFHFTGFGTPQRQRKDGPYRPASPPGLAAFEGFAGPVLTPANSVLDLGSLVGLSPYDRRGEGTTKLNDAVMSLAGLLGVSTVAFDDAEKRKRANKQRQTSLKAATTRLRNARER